MRLTAILAVSRDGAIGDTRSPTGMPWPRLARDLRRFRDTTMGRVCIVGRKTYDTLPPLKDRRLYVLTRGEPTNLRNADRVDFIANNLDEAIFQASHRGGADGYGEEDEVFIIGGAEIYREAFARTAPALTVDRILLTVVEADYPDADVRLERPEALTEGWLPLARETCQPDESNPVRVTFSEWGRP